MSTKKSYATPVFDEIWTSGIYLCASVGAGIDGVNENDGVWDDTTF